MLEKYSSSTKELVVRPTPEPAALDVLHTYSQEKELTITDLWQLLGRRRRIVIGTALSFFVAMGIYCTFATRRYEAMAEVQVQKEQNSSLGLDGGTSQPDVSDSLQDTITLQTQAGILESDTLALQVIKDLKLEGTDDFHPTFNPIYWVLGALTPDGPTDPRNASLDDSPRRRLQVLEVFAKNLKVKPVAGTRLIDITYLNSDPHTAAAVVNALTKGLSDYKFKTRHDATAQTADWLASQLSDLRKQSEELQAKVATLQRESGVFTLGGTDALGREQLYSTVLDKLQQATTAFTAAQSNRIAKEAVNKIAQGGDAEAISSLNTAMTGGASGMETALGLIQNLRMQQSVAKAQLADLSAKFGPAYPKLAELQGQVDTIGDSIKTEVQRLGQRAENDFQVAKQVENTTRAVYLDSKHQADALNDKTIEYTILRQEADESRTLYETLFKQLKQAGVLADFKNNNIAVVDPARIPAKPARPRVILYMLASLMAGSFFGCCAALLRDVTDSKIRDLPALETQLGTTPLGILPYHAFQKSRIKGSSSRTFQPKRYHIPKGIAGPVPSYSLPVSTLELAPEAAEFLAVTHPHSPYIEAVRALRTSLLLSRGGSPPQVILVTSSVAGEGKSMLSINLAALLAQQQKKVLIIDGDLRRPRLHKVLKLQNNEGLSSFLAGQGEDVDALNVLMPSHETPNLFALPAGPMPPYPAELLGSEQMLNGLSIWRDNFDFIVIDGAPVLPVTDSVVLSSVVDFSLLVARYKMTERQSLDRSYRLLLGQTAHRKIGVVMNAVSREESSYYHYYGYKDSSYYTSEERSHEVA